MSSAVRESLIVQKRDKCLFLFIRQRLQRVVGLSNRFLVRNTINAIRVSNYGATFRRLPRRGPVPNDLVYTIPFSVKHCVIHRYQLQTRITPLAPAPPAPELYPFSEPAPPPPPPPGNAPSPPLPPFAPKAAPPAPPP